MKRRNEISDSDNALREALRLMVEDSAPAAGWEERVLAEAPKPLRRRRRRWLVPGLGAAAAAAVAVLAVMTGAPDGGRESEETDSTRGRRPVLMIAQAPETPDVLSLPESPRRDVPSSAESPEPPGRVGQPAAAPSEAPRVILPESLAMSDEEPSDLDIYVADYIDEVLARSLMAEQALVASVIDPFEDTSYTPLY